MRGLVLVSLLYVVFFFNDTATTEIYTLSLHDALPIFTCAHRADPRARSGGPQARRTLRRQRSEEHTSELQSRCYLVCRLLLEKKTNTPTRVHRSGTIGSARACAADTRGC